MPEIAFAVEGYGTGKTIEALQFIKTAAVGLFHTKTVCNPGYDLGGQGYAYNVLAHAGAGYSAVFIYKITCRGGRIGYASGYLKTFAPVEVAVARFPPASRATQPTVPKPALPFLASYSLRRWGISGL